MADYSDIKFDLIYSRQIENQIKLLLMGSYEGFASHDIRYLPNDDPKLMSYHIQQLMSEIGEVLEADKRWKNFRKDKFDRTGKLMELADCFIVLMNISIFSGFTASELIEAILTKESIVSNRIDAERK